MDSRTITYNRLFYPLWIVGLFAAFTAVKNADQVNYISAIISEWRWFNYHPLLMSFAFVVLSGLATLLKKIGGYENTKLHGLLLAIAFWSSAAGLYVIWSNKEAINKPHFMTTHGQLGLFVIIAYFVLMMVGGLLLHPDFGLEAFKRNPNIRRVHKYFGKFTLALSWYCVYTGYATISISSTMNTILAFFLLGLSYFVILK